LFGHEKAECTGEKSRNMSEISMKTVKSINSCIQCIRVAAEEAEYCLRIKIKFERQARTQSRDGIGM
jgi:hypothetical protein